MLLRLKARPLSRLIESTRYRHLSRGAQREEYRCPPIAKVDTYGWQRVRHGTDGRRRYDENGKRPFVEAALRRGVSVAGLSPAEGS